LAGAQKNCNDLRTENKSLKERLDNAEAENKRLKGANEILKREELISVQGHLSALNFQTPVALTPNVQVYNVPPNLTGLPNVTSRRRLE
jgi:hypothetical protein